MSSTPSSFWQLSERLNRYGTKVAAVALLLIMAIVCCDIIFRRFGLPVKGAYDIVRILSVLALSCVLPATTAAKSHVSIDYFFHKFNRANRRRIDIVIHSILVFVFCVASFQCVMAGWNFYTSGEVSTTLRLPIFWVPWVLALGLLLSSFSSLRHLLSRE